MKIEITSKELLGLVKDRLEHLHSCRDFIEEFQKRKLHELVFEAQAKDKYEHNRDRFKKELESYAALCKEHALAEELKPSGPVRALLYEIEELEACESLVRTLSITDVHGTSVRYSREFESMRSQLDRLTGFDDSE